MVIASITYSDKPELSQVKLPIKQIGIELYEPLPGGAYITERFAPSNVPVAHMLNYSDNEKVPSGS